MPKQIFTAERLETVIAPDKCADIRALSEQGGFWFYTWAVVGNVWSALEAASCIGKLWSTESGAGLCTTQ